MAGRRLTAVFAAGMLGAGLIASCIADYPRIVVYSPDGGEVWEVGTSRLVTWGVILDEIENVRIELSRDGGATWELIALVPAEPRSYAWTVTSGASSNCLVRVSDAARGSLADMSNGRFTVAEVIVTSPNGSETWYYQGVDRTITWTSGGVAGNVDIHYSTDAGASWTDVALDVADAGSHSWTIPDEASDQCLVRVRQAGGGVSDESDAAFTITPATVTVWAPNGGETWYHQGDDHTIMWSSHVAGNMDIHYSTDGGIVWKPVALDTPNDSYYDWTIPDEDSTQCLVRVRQAGGSVSDESDAAFTIILAPFGNAAAGLTEVSLCSLAWGDYDNDGDIDLALAGYADSGRISRIYRNDGGTFTDIGAGLIGVSHCSLAWGDYDNDGDLDLALAGGWYDGITHYESKIYRNDGGETFTDIGAGLTGVYMCSLAWGDYDGDGDLDLALAGNTGAGYTSAVYRNDGAGTFIDIAAGLTGVIVCSLAWGDYDGDGDLDLALAGHVSNFTKISKIYRNDGGGTFTDIAAGLTGVSRCSLAWGDYDNDGDLDLALAGSWYDGFGHKESKIYRNDGGGTFTDIAAQLRRVDLCSLAWGDYDNDGDLDLALTGRPFTSYVSKIYRNDGGGVFTDSIPELTGVIYCSLAWGDYDNDGDLDLALSGQTDDSPPMKIIRLYRNNGGVFNTAPAAPVGLGATYTGTGPYDVTFSWAAPAVADETPEEGLSYNLRVGTTPGGNEVFSGMAQADGWRKLPARGVAQPGLSVTEWTLTLPADTYYWSVQAVDTAFAGSAWPAEQTTTVP